MATGSQRWTTGQLIVRVTPSSAWTRRATSLASSSMSRACARAMTSSGPARLAVSETPGKPRSAAATMGASFGLDQDVRGDHVTLTQPSGTIQPLVRSGVIPRASGGGRPGWTRVLTTLPRQFRRARCRRAGPGARRPRCDRRGSLPAGHASRIPSRPRPGRRSHRPRGQAAARRTVRRGAP